MAGQNGCLGFLGSIIFTSRSGLYILDIADHFITNYGLVIGGLLECLIVGWILKATVLREHMNRFGIGIHKSWEVFIKFTTPALLLYLLYLSCAADLANNYEGYATGQLLTYGIGWLGICLIVAFSLSLVSWKPEKMQRRHLPEEDDLLV